MKRHPRIIATGRRPPAQHAVRFTMAHRRAEPNQLQTQPICSMNPILQRTVLIVSIAFLAVRSYAQAPQAPDPLDSLAMRYVTAFTLSDVACGADTFAVLADHIYTSQDGMCWTKRVLNPSLREGRGGLTYGNGQFVAVGEGVAFLSKDGTSWQRSATLPDWITKVTFGAGAYLAVGQEYNPRRQSGTHWLVMNSSDGINWNRQSGPTNENEQYYLAAAAYGAGRFVVGGWTLHSQTLVMTSTNLIDWVRVPDFPTPTVTGITYGNGMFVAVGSSIVTSADGLVWNVQGDGSLNGFSAIAYGQGNFVAAGADGRLWSSPDAALWTPHESGIDGIRAVTYGHGSFVAVGGFYTAEPRGVAVQSGGRPQACVEALGFGSAQNPGFHVLLTADPGRAYRLQSSPVLPANSWTEVGRVEIGAWRWPATIHLIDPTASPTDPQRFYRLISP